MKKFQSFLAILLLSFATACGGCSDEAGLHGESCDESDDCRGECVGGTCEGYGEGGFDGETCSSDNDCRGTCDSGECTGGGTANNANNTTNNANNATNIGSTIFDTNDQGQVLCGNDVCACNDGMDNDGDGLIDGFDPECTGPYDDDEETFATGIPGDNKDPKWQDCFFDGNSGAGDDGCRYHTDCLTGDKPLDDEDCEVALECIDFCAPRTPNGCDCFGCCEVTADGNTAYVVIGSDCSLDNVDECQSCVQNDECINECGRCELCLGKTEADLPADCSDGGGFVGTPCTVDSQCQGTCGADDMCEGHGSGGGNGDACMTDGDCRGSCGADNTCTGGGSGFSGDPCAADADCQGECGADDQCSGYGSGGYDGETCQSDGDCRGSCGGDNTCTGGGSGGGSGVQCDNGDPCNVDSDCTPGPAYCQQGCCQRIEL